MGDLGSILELGRSPREGKGYPLQYSGLENSMECIVHGVTKSWTRLSDFHFLSMVVYWFEGGPTTLILPNSFSFSSFIFGYVGSLLLCRLSLVAVSGGYSLAAVSGFLIAVASLVEHAL